MKLKSNLLASLILIIASLLAIGNTARAQLYNKSKGDDTQQSSVSNLNSDATTSDESARGSGGLFRDSPPCDDSGDGPPGSECSDDGAPGDDDPEPIGEGVLILSLLSGAYAMVKKNIKNRNEE